MQIQCKICENIIEIPYEKGMKLFPRVCSWQCFQELLCITGLPTLPFREGISARVYQHQDYSMRSFYERRFVENINQLSIRWLYEPFIFSFKQKTPYRYVPDFFLPDYNVFIEVKGGLWEGSAYNKTSVFSTYYPIFVVTPEVLKILGRKL